MIEVRPVVKIPFILDATCTVVETERENWRNINCSLELALPGSLGLEKVAAGGDQIVQNLHAQISFVLRS